MTRPPHKLKRRHDGTLHRQRRRLAEHEMFWRSVYGREFLEPRCHGFIQFNVPEIFMNSPASHYSYAQVLVGRRNFIGTSR